MSKIGDIETAILAKMATACPGFTRIPNPYSVTENTALIIKNGYGVAVGPGENTERFVSCQTTWRREFTLVLISQVLTLENDTIGKASFVEDILDIHTALLLDFENDVSLGGEVIKAVVSGDSGPQFLDGASSQFMLFEITLLVEYLQPSA